MAKIDTPIDVEDLSGLDLEDPFDFGDDLSIGGDWFDLDDYLGDSTYGDWRDLFGIDTGGGTTQVVGDDEVFNPWAEWEDVDIGSGDFDYMSAIKEFWEGLELDPGWGEEGSGGGDTWDDYKDLFEEWDPEGWHAGEIERLEDQAQENIEDYITGWDLSQEFKLREWNLEKGFHLDDLEEIIRNANAEFDLLKTGEGGFNDQLDYLAEIWNLSQEDTIALKEDLEEMWGEGGLEILSREDQIKSIEDLYIIKADELARQGISAQELWQMSQTELDALGISANEIWAIERANYLRQQEEVTGLWGAEEAEYRRRAGVAGDVWNYKAADIARKKLEAGTMWGLEEAAYKEAWMSEKEVMAYGAQSDIRKAQQTQAQILLKTGFANAPTAFDDVETILRRDHGMKLSAGEKNLTNQLQIGVEKLTQREAGLMSELNMSALELENTLAELSVAKDISEAEYNSKIATLASKIDMGEQTLKDLLNSYERDRERADYTLDNTLAELEAAGLIDENKEAALIKVLQDQIDIGSANLANELDRLDREEIIALATYNQDVARVEHAIAMGELTVEQAISEGQLNYDQAMALGYFNYEEAIAMGAYEFEIGIGNIYDTLSNNIWLTVRDWRNEQAGILAEVFAGDIFVKDGGDGGGDDYYLGQNNVVVKTGQTESGKDEYTYYQWDGEKYTKTGSGYDEIVDSSWTLVDDDEVYTGP